MYCKLKRFMLLSLLFYGVGIFGAPIININTGGNSVYHLAVGEINGERVVVSASYNGEIQCFSQSTKTELWSFDIGGAFPFDVDLGDIDGDGNDDVLIAASDGKVYAIKSDGSGTHWVYQESDRAPMHQVKFVYSKGDRFVFTGGASKKLFKLNALNGTQMAQLNTAGSIRLLNSGQINMNNTDYIAVADAQRTLSGNFTLRVVNVQTMGLLNNQSLALNYPGSQFGTLAKGRYYNIEVLDIDKDGSDELVLPLDHRNPTWLTVIDMEGASIKQKNIQDDSGKNIRTKPYAMNYIQHIKSNKLAQEYIFQLYGNDLLVKSLSGRILNEHKGNYTYNSCVFDPITSTFFMGSELSGGDVISCLSVEDGNGWGNAFANAKSVGKMKILENNINLLSSQINAFNPDNYPYQPKVENVKVVPGDKAWGNIVNKYNPASYNNIDFGLYLLITEDYDRSKNPNPWNTKKDHRHPYTDKAADIIARAANYERNKQNFTVWAGHGMDPFYMQLSTLEGIMTAAPNTFQAFVFAELEETSNTMQNAINQHLKPLAELCKIHNKKILLRNKNIFWFGTAYQPLWWNLLKNKEFSDVFVLSMEETSDHLQELSLAGRTGLWLTGYSNMVSGRAVTDNSNWLRLWEYCYNVESLSNQIRTMSLQRMLGADFFHINIYTQNETMMIPFYKMIEKGILPKPGREDIISLSDFAIGMKSPPNNQFFSQGTNHHVMSSYKPNEEMKVIDKVAAYWGGAPIPEHDITNYAFNSTRRMTNFLPQFPYGNIAVVPAEINTGDYPQLKSKFDTDGRYWYDNKGTRYEADAFKSTVEDSLEAAAKRLPIRVYGDVSWTAVRLDKSRIRLLLLDPGYLDPHDREAEIHLQGLNAGSTARDILKNQDIPVNDKVFKVTVPMGILLVIDITTNPYAHAGEDMTFDYVPDSVVFFGDAGDDTMIVSQKWTKVSGPGCTLINPDSMELTVKDLEEGIYVFSLSATDNGGNTATDQVKLTVFCTLCRTPEVHISANRLVQLPKDTINLQGNATVEKGTIASYLWEKISGPDLTISGASTYQITLGNLLAGAYTFRLTATSSDNIQSFNEVSVNILPTADSIPKANNPWLIDGTPEEALCGSLFKIDKPIKGFSNSFANAGLAWDENHLYVYVAAEDKYLMHDSENDWWDDDAIELLIDADNSKGNTFGAKDFRYGFRWHWNESEMDMFEPIHNATTGVVWKLKEVKDGYNLEAAIPWTTLNHTPSVGDKIGIEIRLLIDDDGFINDAIKALYGYSGEAVPTPSQFGTLVLGEVCLITNLNSNRDNRIRIYPSVTRGMLTIEPDQQEVFSCKVYDITGKVVYVNEFIGKSTLNVSCLPAGIYYMGFEGKGVATTLKFTKL